jgi:hypothetical protein
VTSPAVTLAGGCLNAQFNAMAGSTIYGVSNMTLFQVSLTSTKPGQVPPGTWKLNVRWAGAPTAAGGAIGAALVLKLHQQ